MRKYRIVCSDLDGTLFNDHTQISRENLAAINALIQKGVYFVPSTGRTFSELPAVLKEHPSVRYIIHSNGAAVLDKQTNARILTCIPNQATRKVLDLLNRYETHLTIRHEGNCIVDAAYIDERSFDYYHIIEAHRGVVRDYGIYKEDFKAFSYSAENVEVISVFFHNYADKLTCKKAIEEMGGLRAVEVAEYNLEIVNIDAGKGNALYALADMLGVEYADTISIGDSDNDASIIQAAGLGLAVSNACPSLKEVADAVICSNEEHVVPYVLEHYF